MNLSALIALLYQSLATYLKRAQYVTGRGSCFVPQPPTDRCTIQAMRPREAGNQQSTAIHMVVELDPV